MQLTYNNKDYDIVINKKFSQKNTYIRVKKDLKVTVTTNYFVTNHAIDKLIKDNYDRICKMIDFQEKKVKNNNGFFYLGKQYVVIHSDIKGIKFDDDKVYIGNDFDIDNWYKKEAKLRARRGLVALHAFSRGVYDMRFKSHEARAVESCRHLARIA